MYRAGVIFLAAILAACGDSPDHSWQGYIEGEFVQLASPYAGQLQKLHVRRGDPVVAGKPVFVLEQENERAAREEAGERLRTALARLENLQQARRPTEIDAQRAELAQARTQRELAALQFAQQERLYKAGFISQARFDEVRSAYALETAKVLAQEAQLKTALQPVGRDAERKAAAGEVAAARAAVEQAAWRLEQKSVGAPVSGLVQDTFFVEGEWVPAGRPVAALLPPGNVKARFYVAETALSSLAPGREVILRCDGCPDVTAKVSYISSQAEYTPPVLYGKETRQKLMFLIEARPDPRDAAGLRPGQPIDVRLK
jgi:HlyD family secretion protein